MTQPQWWEIMGGRCISSKAKPLLYLLKNKGLFPSRVGDSGLGWSPTPSSHHQLLLFLAPPQGAEPKTYSHPILGPANGVPTAGPVLGYEGRMCALLLPVRGPGSRDQQNVPCFVDQPGSSDLGSRGRKDRHLRVSIPLSWASLWSETHTWCGKGNRDKHKPGPDSTGP